MLIMLLLLQFSSKDAVPAEELKTQIELVSETYNVDPLLLTKVILAESAGRAHAINNKSHDYGLMQINIKTANSLGIDMACLLDWKCNLEVGANILGKLKRPCQYNVGRKSLNKKRMFLCLQYERKLANIQILEVTK